jgi:hypothetical protein
MSRKIVGDDLDREHCAGDECLNLVRPRLGQRSFCRECRTAGEPAKQAARDYRKRQAEARAYTSLSSSVAVDSATPVQRSDALPECAGIGPRALQRASPRPRRTRASS